MISKHSWLDTEGGTKRFLFSISLHFYTLKLVIEFNKWLQANRTNKKDEIFVVDALIDRDSIGKRCEFEKMTEINGSLLSVFWLICSVSVATEKNKV